MTLALTAAASDLWGARQQMALSLGWHTVAGGVASGRVPHGSAAGS